VIRRESQRTAILLRIFRSQRRADSDLACPPRHRPCLVIPSSGKFYENILAPDDQVARGFLFVVVKGELTPIKNNQKKEQK
jgi:hypothetical protein